MSRTNLLLRATAGGPDLVLDGAAVTVGRASDNAVVLADPTVAERAVRIAPAADGWHLKPLGTAITVNGIALRDSTRLLRGDRIAIGRFRYTVTNEQRVTTAPPPAGTFTPAAGFAPVNASGGAAGFANAAATRTAGAAADPGIELLDVPLRAPPVVPAAWTAGPERSKVFDDARAQMAWGHPLEKVRLTLVTGGFTDAEARDAMAEMMAAERTETRTRGMRQIAYSIPILVIGLFILGLLGGMTPGRVKVTVFAVAIALFGLGGVVHGIWRVTTGARERHQIA